MTWQEVNDMKPGTRVVVEHADRDFDVGRLLERCDAPGWKFKRVSDGTNSWVCDNSNDSTFRNLPNGWGRNGFVYRVVHHEGRNKL